MKNCPFCNHNKLEIFKRINNFNVVLCQTCGIAITDVPIKLTQTRINTSVYSDEYLKLYEERQQLLINRFASKVKLIDKYVNGGSILDVGCSTGLFLQAIDKFARNKWVKYGIDINKKSVNLANKKKVANIIQTDLHHKHFSDSFFNVITCFDILEHDTDLKGNLEEMRRILKPNGFLIIQVPNRNSWMAKICGDNWDWWSVPDHVYHFTPNSLKRIILGYGYLFIKSFTWEDTIDFIRNIQGTLKKKLSRIFYLNRILSKLSLPFIIILVYIIKFIENIKPIGGLYILVLKNNK